MPDFWNDPNSDWSQGWNMLAHKDWGAPLAKGADDAAVALNYAPKHADPNAPGTLLDATQSDQDKSGLGALIAQLQQQAATGGGAWETALKDATQKSQNAAMAMGQSQPGGGYASALRNIGNAQGASAQKAVGQGNILRAQSQAGAQDQLSGVLGSQGQSDAAQAAAQAAARQGVTELNSTLAKNANGSITKDTTSAGGMLSPFMSDGGKVPGRANVFGDDNTNDVVPAMLSPGEIVIPRSHTGTPEDAARFVAAVKSRGGLQNMADGGAAGDGSGLTGPDSSSQETADGRLAGVVSIVAPHIGAAMRQPHQSAPTIANGGLLDASAYNDTRNAYLNNANLINQRVMGKGPSVAGQQLQDSIDANMSAGAAGPASGARLTAATLGSQGAAGNAAATAGNEQASGQMQFAQALQRQRAQDQAMAQAQQQAAFRQTLMNAGIGIEQQAALRGMLSNAGQAASAWSSAAGGKDKSYNLNDKNTPSFDAGGSEPGEWNSYSGGSSSGPADLHDSNDMWKGGIIKKKNESDFAAAVRRRMSP